MNTLTQRSCHSSFLSSNSLSHLCSCLSSYIRNYASCRTQNVAVPGPTRRPTLLKPKPQGKLKGCECFVTVADHGDHMHLHRLCHCQRTCMYIRIYVQCNELAPIFTAFLSRLWRLDGCRGPEVKRRHAHPRTHVE